MSKWVALGLLLGERLIEIQLNGKCLKARQSINASLEVAHARPVTTIRDRVTDAYHLIRPTRVLLLFFSR